MGHSEMSLAVAGLDDASIRERTKRLATGNWADFPAGERLAFQIAFKITREPWTISQSDMRRMINAYGKHRTIDLIWYSSWCNYMTRVADAFQLPLEKENVFMSPTAAKK